MKEQVAKKNIALRANVLNKQTSEASITRQLSRMIASDNLFKRAQYRSIESLEVHTSIECNAEGALEPFLSV